MSTALADQLGLKKTGLEKPISVQLAVQESCTKVNTGVTVKFEYAGINEDRWFDLINIEQYNMILGGPFFLPTCLYGRVKP
jgi:hypothetical protein